MTEQTPTPSTASARHVGNAETNPHPLPSAATAPPLPLVRHHREGGDEPALFELNTDAKPVFATEWAVQREMGRVINYREDEEEARARLEKGDALLQRTVLLGPWSVTS